MLNDKDKEAYKAKFGSLMTRYAIVSRVIKDYDNELKSIQKEIDGLMQEIIGVENGKSVQQEKSVQSVA